MVRADLGLPDAVDYNVNVQDMSRKSLYLFIIITNKWIFFVGHEFPYAIVKCNEKEGAVISGGAAATYKKKLASIRHFTSGNNSYSNCLFMLCQKKQPSGLWNYDFLQYNMVVFSTWFSNINFRTRVLLYV